MRASPSVAIIEASRSVRDALVMLVSANGYRVEVYDTNEEFLAQVEHSRAECLVVDVRPDGLCGTELSRRLAARGFTIPIIFLATGDDRKLLKRMVDADCFAFLRGPTDCYWLLDFIAEAVWRP
jgi:FixJ family two-component response regulator